MKLVTSAEMRALEAAAVEAGVSEQQLMEEAGLAVAQEAWMLLGSLDGRRIVVLAGPGNNGGDGLVAARNLYDWGAEVRVYRTNSRPGDA
ncbi:MAG: NAD(P)H-hydrate epimerase, partial [Tepidiformaceae bacterium]